MIDPMLANILIERAPALWAQIWQHLLVLTGIPMGLAIAIGIPAGILAAKRPWLKGIILSLCGTIQTIPSLAMLGFLLALTNRIGSVPAVIALTLYALLSIIRNTCTGLEELPKSVREAADGVGFTTWQKLWMVEVPLAMPVILAGIRTATVICVGIATLSTYIGAGGLGDFINRGLVMDNNVLILLGACSATVLALILDSALGLLVQLLRPGRKPAGLCIKAIALGSFTALLVCGLCILKVMAPADSLTQADFEQDLNEDPREIKIGSKNFTEQFIVGEILAQLIENHTSLRVVRVFNLGGTVICHNALINGSIDLYPEYTGTGLMTILKESTGGKSPEAILSLVDNAYNAQFGCDWLAPFGFNNTYALAVRRADAEKNNWKTISDLKDAAGTLRAAFTSEFMEREDGYPGLRARYKLHFKQAVDIDPQLMYKAAAMEQTDVICAFSTDGRIQACDLVTLRDDLGFFPPYHAVPVIRGVTLETYPEMKTILAKLAKKIDDQTMQRMNYEVDEKKRSPRKVARAFLLKHKLIADGGGTSRQAEK